MRSLRSFASLALVPVLLAFAPVARAQCHVGVGFGAGVCSSGAAVVGLPAATVVQTPLAATVVSPQIVAGAPQVVALSPAYSHQVVGAAVVAHGIARPTVVGFAPGVRAHAFAGAHVGVGVRGGGGSLLGGLLGHRTVNKTRTVTRSVVRSR